MSANCVAFTSCCLFSWSSSHYFPHAFTMLIEGGCIIGRSTFRELLPSPLSTLKPYRELRCPMSNQIVLHRLLPAWLNTPPRLHLCLITEFQLQKLYTASDFQLHIFKNHSVTRLTNANVTRSTNDNLSSLTNGNIPNMTDANLTKLFVKWLHTGHPKQQFVLKRCTNPALTLHMGVLSKFFAIKSH